VLVVLLMLLLLLLLVMLVLLLMLVLLMLLVLLVLMMRMMMVRQPIIRGLGRSHSGPIRMMCRSGRELGSRESSSRELRSCRSGCSSVCSRVMLACMSAVGSVMMSDVRMMPVRCG
jgi:hypothetical protein